MDEVLQGLVYAGLFFLGFFIGVLSMKYARRKQFKIREKDKPKVKGIMDTGVSTGEVVNAVKALEKLPEPEEEHNEEEMVNEITRNDLAKELIEKTEVDNK